MLSLGGRGCQFRFRLVAAQRLSNESCVTTRFNRILYKFPAYNTDFRRFASPVNFNSLRSFSTTFPQHRTLQSFDDTPETQPTQPSLDELTAEVYQVLRNGEPRQILLTLGDPIYEDVVALMPDSVFVSALLRITPEYFLKPFLDILTPMHGAQLSVRNINTSAGILFQFFQPFNQILLARQFGGNPFGLVEYRHLLQFSASTGDLRSTISLWKRMRQSGIEPDLRCYNIIMHASVWEGAVYGRGKYRVRVTPYYYRRRRFGVGIPGYGTAGRSVRREVRSIFKEMESQGLAPDEDTYINLLLASARVGGRLDMDKILKEVWMVDVEAIATTRPPARVPAARPLVESSPIYPTRKLLFAVAHAYGCNSRFRTGLRIINYISQQYGIEITDDIWAELSERTFVLSRRRIGKYGKANRLGKLNHEILFGLKGMLRLDGQPYDMVVYRMLVKSVGYLKQFRRFRELTREAYQLLRRTRRERNHALRVLENSLNIPLRVDSVSHPIEESGLRENCEAPQVWRALQKYEKLRLLAEQQQIIIEKIVEYAVFVRRWTHRWDFEFTHRLLPNFLAEWKDFLPESYSIILRTGAGQIEFCGRTDFYDANIRTHNNEPVRWSDCGEFVAEEDEQIEPRHEVLWAHVRYRLGELADLRPLQWFLRNGWKEDLVYSLQLRGPRVSDRDEFGEDPSLDGIAEESVQEHQVGQPRETEHEVPQHCFYVTMIPLYHIPL